MAKTQDKKRNQNLGIFYTRQEVVNFIFQILKIWKDKEDKETKRWQSRKPRPHYPSVIDPACGEGVFLKAAITSGFTGEDPRFKAPYVWGIDLDKSVVDRWEQISLLSLFHGDKAKMNNHFYHQNGLLPLEEKHLMYKNAEEGLHAYDAVVGNPPYGGVGLESITPELERALFDYFIWKHSVRKNTSSESDQLGLLERQSLDSKEKERLIKFPIEILFLDRFIQLAKPGGWIAIIIPDGILTNSNAHFVREFLSERAKIEAIISLPRETFKDAGTNAKTSILFLRKLMEREKQEQNYKVFLASVEKINKENFDLIVKSYEKLYNLGGKHMNNSDFIQITKDQTGREAIMLRADKTLKQLMDEKPFSRWNAEYWHPKYEKIYKILNSQNPSTLREIEGENCLISGDHVRKSRGESKGYKLSTGIEYYETKGFLPVAYNYAAIKECSRNAYERLKATRVSKNDILISCAGVGGVGKAKNCIITHTPKERSCTGDVFILRVKRLNPYFLYIYLNGIFGQYQILRQQAGTGTVNINSEQTLSILVPDFSNQKAIELAYMKILQFHDKAMQAEKNKDDKEYKLNSNIAEKMFKELVIRTEEVIKGERNDIN